MRERKNGGFNIDGVMEDIYSDQRLKKLKKLKEWKPKFDFSRKKGRLHDLRYGAQEVK